MPLTLDRLLVVTVTEYNHHVLRFRFGSDFRAKG